MDEFEADQEVDALSTDTLVSTAPQIAAQKIPGYQPDLAARVAQDVKGISKDFYDNPNMGFGLEVKLREQQMQEFGGMYVENWLNRDVSKYQTEYLADKARVASNQFAMELRDQVKAGNLDPASASKQLTAYSDKLLGEINGIGGTTNPKILMEAQNQMYSDALAYTKHYRDDYVTGQQDRLLGDFEGQTSSFELMAQKDFATAPASMEMLGSMFQKAVGFGVDPRKAERVYRNGALAVQRGKYNGLLAEEPARALEIFNQEAGQLAQLGGAQFANALGAKITTAFKTTQNQIAKEVKLYQKKMAEGYSVDAQHIIDKGALYGYKDLAEYFNLSKAAQIDLQDAPVAALQQAAQGTDVKAEIARNRLNALNEDPLGLIERAGYTTPLSKVNYLDPNTFVQRDMQVQAASEKLGMQLPTLTTNEAKGLTQRILSKPAREAASIISSIESAMSDQTYTSVVNQLANVEQGSKVAAAFRANAAFRQEILSSSVVNQEAADPAGHIKEFMKKLGGTGLDATVAKHMKDGLIALSESRPIGGQDDVKALAQDAFGIIKGNGLQHWYKKNDEVYFIPPRAMSAQQSQELYSRLTADAKFHQQNGNGTPVGADGKPVDLSVGFHAVPSGRPGGYNLVSTVDGKFAAVIGKDGVPRKFEVKAY